MTFHASHYHRCPSCAAKLKWALEDFQFVVMCDKQGCAQSGRISTAVDLAGAFHLFFEPSERSE